MSKFPPQETKGVTIRNVVEDTLRRYPKVMAELKRQEDANRTAPRVMEGRND